jgi:hypothetical protein
MNITNAKNKLLSEIKVNPVSRGFEVTDKGKEYIEDYYKLIELSAKFDVQELLNNEGPESNIFQASQILFILSDKYGENIILLDKPNKLEDYINRYRDIWDADIEGAKRYLKLFMEFNFITNINI